MTLPTRPEDDTSMKHDLLLPIVAGVIAIIAERWIYNHSPALRRFVGADG